VFRVNGHHASLSRRQTEFSRRAAEAARAFDLSLPKFLANSATERPRDFENCCNRISPRLSFSQQEHGIVKHVRRSRASRKCGPKLEFGTENPKDPPPTKMMVMSHQSLQHFRLLHTSCTDQNAGGRCFMGVAAILKDRLPHGVISSIDSRSIAVIRSAAHFFLVRVLFLVLNASLLRSSGGLCRSSFDGWRGDLQYHLAETFYAVGHIATLIAVSLTMQNQGAVSSDAIVVFRQKSLPNAWRQCL